MRNVPRFSRVLAVCALVVSALALGAAPAGAGGGATGSAVANNYYGTATITYAGTTKLEVYIIDGAGSSSCQDTGVQPTTGILGTIGVDSPAPASPFTVTAQTQVGPAPAHALGAGTYSFCLYDVVSGTYTLLEPANPMPIFDPVTASIVDDGNGGIILTYANTNTDLGQIVAVMLLSGATSCPQYFDPTTGSGFSFAGGADGNLPSSPSTITVGTTGFLIPLDITTLIPVPAQLTAGQYLACLYYTDVETSSVEVQQSFSVSIHAPVEPVVPSFTG